MLTKKQKRKRIVTTNLPIWAGKNARMRGGEVDHTVHKRQGLV
jgi:hypothetical protein